MGSVFHLTLRQLTGKWRLIIMTVLGVLPVLFAAGMVSGSDAPFVAAFETVVLST